MHKSFSRDTNVKYLIEKKKKRKIKRNNTHVAYDPLGTSEILRVKLWQHKLKIRKVERYCADAYRLSTLYVTLTASRIPLRFLFHKGYNRDNGNEIVFRRIEYIFFFQNQKKSTLSCAFN